MFFVIFYVFLSIDKRYRTVQKNFLSYTYVKINRTIYLFPKMLYYDQPFPKSILVQMEDDNDTKTTSL